MDAPRPTKDFARTLRRRMSLPEVLLWRTLKGRQLHGLHFRRQHPIGPYVLDFYCDQLQLAVEIDGDTHLARTDADAARDAWLTAQGIQTVRISARDVLDSHDAGASLIENAIQLRG
ncbi:endonuclease domain-containing protein [Phenylobacterium deserti]|uniref:DUF559 domain-containing protein n=1 Tax=Phenylobacterium deserti TaxID=1914756 RepID=A0A328AFA5_9CAUL|nr:DUF559 domain-containing protein [Phenylobacterium deserti]RAK51478.1 hypothetical protein DJ018_16220 [Phenylobacterium deserti]